MVCCWLTSLTITFHVHECRFLWFYFLNETFTGLNLFWKYLRMVIVFIWTGIWHFMRYFSNKIVSCTIKIRTVWINSSFTFTRLRLFFNNSCNQEIFHRLKDCIYTISIIYKYLEIQNNKYLNELEFKKAYVPAFLHATLIITQNM